MFRNTPLSPNMVALTGSAIGVRISRQDVLGYTTHRGPAQRNKIKTFILSIPLILLYHFLGGRLTGPTMATPANLPSGTVSCTAPPSNSPTKTILAPRDAKYVHKRPTRIQHTQHTNHILKHHNRRTPYTNLDSMASPNIPCTTRLSLALKSLRACIS
jgi:hypothetical protein